MKLSKIKYSSAGFFGVMALIVYFLVGALQYSIRNQIATSYGVAPVTAMMAFVYTPLIGGIVAYVFTLLAILVYNAVAKYSPIAWEVHAK